MSRLKLYIPLLLLAATSARADTDCSTEGSQYNSQIDDLSSQLQGTLDDGQVASITAQRQHLYDLRIQKQDECRDLQVSDAQKQKKIQKAQDDCQKNIDLYPSAYSWDSTKNKCVNKAEQASNKALPDNGDDCSAANVFAGNLKGQNCKKAASVVKDARSRTSAITDATTAATTAYAGMQATGATGAQDDAQTRQANIYKTLAFSKFATGLVNMVGAAQLKNAASDAESANSAITGSMKNIQAACANSDDDQACFYQNAPKYGIPNDERSYASYDRMKRGAQQSQDQADAANSLAKSSLITGAADMMTGMQAMQAAKIANTNAQQMAPPPLIAAPPVGFTAFGDSGGGPTAPGMAPAPSTAPVDYGNPKNTGSGFGAPRRGPMGGGMVAGKMGTPNSFKSASSAVTGGGAAGSVSGNAGGPGKPGARPRAAPRNSTAGEYNLAGGGGAKGGGGGGDKRADDNPLADMLAKMFPQAPNGAPVVDARQIASAAGAAQEEEQPEAVTAAELSIFDQITAKYHQLNGDGRL